MSRFVELGHFFFLGGGGGESQDLTMRPWGEQKIVFICVNLLRVQRHAPPRTFSKILQFAGAPNSAKFRWGVADGHQRFDKGGVAIIFYFLRVELFRVFTLSD